MSRRKKGAKPGLKPQLRTDRHLAGNFRTPTHVEYRTAHEPPAGREWAARLTWGGNSWPTYSPERLASIILHRANSEVQWICDSNLFIAPTDQVIWDALLAKKNRLVVTAMICHELRIWINAEDSCNPSMINPLEMVFKGDVRGPIRLINVPENNPPELALLEYYANLIGMRKKASNLASKSYEKEFGEHPSNQQLSNYIKDRMGSRAQLIASSGSKAKKPANKFNDEATIVLTLVDAIRSGRETVILTGDQGVYEQFYKALWIIDTHYRSYLLAERYHSDPTAFFPVQRVMDSERIAFEGEVRIFDRPSDDMTEVLPAHHHKVPIHCMLIQESFHHRSFMAEREMSQMLDIKGKTGYLSTDRLDGLNCHIYLGPFMDVAGNRAAIGRDIMIGAGNDRTLMSLLDVNLVLNDCEGLTRIMEVDPRFIILPDRPRLIL